MPPTRQAFDAQLHELEQDLLRLGSHVEEMEDQAVRALLNRDAALAQVVIDSDDLADDLDLSIETRCMRLLALQQPMAKDLRTIGTFLKAITDLERIGDYSVDIARIALRLVNHPGPLPRVDLAGMSEAVKTMNRHTLRAFVDRDLEAVHRICEEEDDIVDHAYHHMVDELLELMRSEPGQVVPAAYFILAARSLERIADHLTNVAERIQYMETGVLEELA
jgi:phosphate transport system protein